jgi:hypothetical protein
LGKGDRGNGGGVLMDWDVYYGDLTERWLNDSLIDEGKEVSE